MRQVISDGIPPATPLPGRSVEPSRERTALATLLVLWVGFMGADRINFGAGIVDFIVTPYLALTPFIVLLAFLRLGRVEALMIIPHNTARYCLTVTLFLCVISLSAIFSDDPVLAGRRTILLCVQVYGSLLITILLLNQRAPAAILVRGAYLGLAVATLFLIAQLWYWATGSWNAAALESELFLNFAPRTYGILPRFSGSSIDQTRAGLLYFIYLFVIMRFAPLSRLRTLMICVAVVSLIGTLSRSAMLGALVLAGVYVLERGVKLTRGKLILVSGAVSVAVVLLIAVPSLLETVGLMLEPVASRFTGEEESAQIHFALIEHGLLVATSSLRNALLGVGYGNGWMVLNDFFPGDRFANFHSLYVTLLAESGVFALALGLVLLAYPFLAPAGPFLSVVAGLMAANLFYQSPAEPAFWFIVALAWLTAGAAAPIPARETAMRDGTPQLSLRTTPAIGT